MARANPDPNNCQRLVLALSAKGKRKARCIKKACAEMSHYWMVVSAAKRIDVSLAAETAF